MRHVVNLFGGNIILKILFRVVIPTPNITIFTDASETGWGITMGITHLKVSGQNMKECILMYFT